MKKNGLTPKKLLENVFQRFLVVLELWNNILNIAPNRAAGKGPNQALKIQSSATKWRNGNF